MTSDVVLSAALRTNLLSLQKTQNSIDITQNRLASGKKVNSALDNPQSFFASQALTNRASDLTRLLDSIGQSIQVIKAADNGVTALTKLVEQADSLASSARDALAAGQVEAKAVGNRDLRGIDDLTSLSGITDAGTDTLTFTLTDEDGEAVDIGAYGAAAAATAAVTIAANLSTNELITAINNIAIDDGNGNALGAQAFEASLNDAGYLQIKTLNGGGFNLNFGTVANTDVANLALAADLGFGNIARVVADAGVGTNNVEFSAIADVALRSFAFYDNSGTTPVIASRSTLLSDVTDETGAISRFANISAGDEYIIGINGAAAQDISLTNALNTGSGTIQDFIDRINNNDTLNTSIRAEFDEATGVVTIKTIDASVKSIEIGVQDNNQTLTANFGFGVNADLSATATDGERESIQLAAAAADLAQFESDYNRIRAQIDALVEDTGYRGTNLLNGNDLLTVFNEGRTSTLNTEGVTFTAAGLGLEEANFSREDTVEGALTQVRDALEAVRNFGSTLANDLSVIQTRETFTRALINTLTEGSDKLVNADQNEEGAKLLALQTRQALGVTSLSLASQSQQSILRLF